jgi:2-deoxy-D-gluconate 3-dehydrogenase
MGILDQFNLTGQAAIITGAGTGLGREMALSLADAGCDIVGVGRRSGPIEEVGELIKAKGRRYLGVTGCDVTMSEQVNDMVKQAVASMGRITVLINNAGLGGSGRGKTLPELTDEDWLSGLDSNLNTAFYCTRAIVPHMVENGGGRIISVTSGWGFRAGRNNWMYPVAKGGVIQLMKATAMTYARDNIRASCIAPGLFPKTDDMSMLENIGPKQAAGRIGFPKELGPLAVFLASPAADYLSGTTVLMDGGAIAAGLLPAGIIPNAAG